MFDATTNSMGQPMGQPWNFGGYGQPQMMTYSGIQPQNVQRFMNNLSDEEIDQLQNTQVNFTLNLTNDEHLRAVCNHRTKDGMQDTLVKNPDGTVSCQICGYKFRPVGFNMSKEDIEEYTDSVVDVIQTIKVLFPDIPTDAAKKYFDVIPMIEKIPKLFEYAAQNMAKYENAANSYYMNNYNMGAMQTLNNLNASFGFAPMMQQPQMAPMGYNQPAGMPNPAFANPFGYPNASQAQQSGGYMPATTGFQFVPNQPQPTPAAPVAPTAPTDVTVKQDVQA